MGKMVRPTVVMGLATGVAVGVMAAAMSLTGSVTPVFHPASEQGSTIQTGAAPAPTTSGGASSGQRAESQPGAPDRANDPAASVNYLVQRYRVSAGEAERRLRLQTQSPDLAAQLAQQFPDEYAGMWLDQAGGGVLKVRMTDPAKLSGVVDPAQAHGIPAKWSLKELQAVAQQISETVGADAAEVVVDQVANEVVVRGSDPRLPDLVAQASGAARLERAPDFELKCDPLNCATRPLLGGMRLDVPRDDGSVGGCSAGFRIRSLVTGRQYLLTAGHCVVSVTHTHVDKTWHQYLAADQKAVSIEDADARLVENDPANGNDYAIMPFQDEAAEDRWLYNAPAPDRVKEPLGHFVNYRGRPAVRILGFTPLAQVQVGWVVCASGAGYTPAPGEPYVDSGAGRGYVPGTHCGEVTAKGKLISVRICARKGDSGGPLFTELDGRALGILSGGDSRSGACVPGDTETNHYAAVSSILARVNARTSNAYAFDLVPPFPLPIAPLRNPVPVRG